MWMHYDFGDGPRVNSIVTQLFCAWLAWSRFRAVLALLDKTLPSAMAAIDAALRIFGGAPTYYLGDNKKTVTREHVAGIAVRNRAANAATTGAGAASWSVSSASAISLAGTGIDVALAPSLSHC
jgi:hypothetical protein